ncbi:hypothetical protein G6F37_003009 [Rhizopus arrhizus]|nr:hypothetical protein G6F38_001842 [Rhizopus arrhizus]KAG1161517.1 hypothetical protein G6F37_003009 [Rhizopus arrhizus]
MPTQPKTLLSSSASSPLLVAVEINVHASWSSMKPYCRYCHGDHALKDFVLRKKATTCYWSPTTSATLAVSEETGPATTQIPATDFAKSSTPPVTSPTSVPATSVFIPATPVPIVLAKSKYARVLRSETAGISSTNTTTTANESPSKSTAPVKICPHCKKEGHLHKYHHECGFYVHKQKQATHPSESSREDMEMMESSSPPSSTNDNEYSNNDDGMIVDKPGEDSSETQVAPSDGVDPTSSQ